MVNADEVMGHDWLNLSSYTRYCLKTLRRSFYVTLFSELSNNNIAWSEEGHESAKCNGQAEVTLDSRSCPGRNLTDAESFTYPRRSIIGQQHAGVVSLGG